MANVTIRFVAPDESNIAALHIFEAPTAVGPFTDIERTTEIGAYPNYISSFKTTAATAPDYWFAIAWEDDAGNLGRMSTPLKGGDETLVGKVIERVLQRDRLLDAKVVGQEAEAAVESFFNTDPYTVDLDDIDGSRVYRTLTGLVYLTMARSYLAEAGSQSTVQSATLGIVSFRSESGTQRNIDVQGLIDLANENLGINTSIVLQMEDICRRDKFVQVTEP